MPTFQPAASPRFSCSTTCTSGKRSRTVATVPSAEALSTTIVSSPRTLSRHVSSQGSALWVTTTTETSGMSGARPAADALPEQDHAARHGERGRDEEEEEAGREGGIGIDADGAEEADEEGLAHRDPVQRDRHEQDQEEERAHHVEDARREVDADRARGRPDREDPDRLKAERQRERRSEHTAVRAEGVHAIIKGA